MWLLSALAGEEIGCRLREDNDYGEVWVVRECVHDVDDFYPIQRSINNKVPRLIENHICRRCRRSSLFKFSIRSQSRSKSHGIKSIHTFPRLLRVRYNRDTFVVFTYTFPRAKVEDADLSVWKGLCCEFGAVAGEGYACGYGFRFFEIVEVGLGFVGEGAGGGQGEGGLRGPVF